VKPPLKACIAGVCPTTQYEKLSFTQDNSIHFTGDNCDKRHNKSLCGSLALVNLQTVMAITDALAGSGNVVEGGTKWAGLLG
jgi:hypothetical protein